MEKDFIIGKPDNYEKLKRMANNKVSWRNRLEAVEELGKWKCRQSVDVLFRRMMSDKVFKVQNAAFLKLQAFGENVKLPKKKKGNLVKNINKKLGTIKRSLPEEHSYEEFKQEFKQKRSVEFDIYEGDKEERFDKWLRNVWLNIPKE
ncbi:HEAT repeat domain-containing protein [Proteinivorax hydrogeniformans]|uniref:HEAT repeat domain-containing protein n=1 Tax=Proteinivorax hydrogeniformans TaxID=1826727 RepID=A0AAU8HUY2_9FIRM